MILRGIRPHEHTGGMLGIRRQRLHFLKLERRGGAVDQTAGKLNLSRFVPKSNIQHHIEIASRLGAGQPHRLARKAVGGGVLRRKSVAVQAARSIDLDVGAQDIGLAGYLVISRVTSLFQVKGHPHQSIVQNGRLVRHVQNDARAGLQCG